MIDFESGESHLLLNPRMPAAEREEFERHLPDMPSHVFLATSGSAGFPRLVALSKKAILASADAVNERLNCGLSDVWAAVLPEFHVGGLAVYARAVRAQSRVVVAAWSPPTFAAMCQHEGITRVSLVPAQLWDLVTLQSPAPDCVRTVLVGGGRLEEKLERDAARLGWPVVSAYGSTECASTIALSSAGASGNTFELLAHLEADEDDVGRLRFRGASLFTGYVTPEGAIEDPKVDGWFRSDDRGSVVERTLHLHGREADFVKIGGESVDLRRLDEIARSVAGLDAAVVTAEDERLGHVVHLAVTRDPEAIREAFNACVLPFERAREVHLVPSIPRTPLGKLLRSRLAGALRR